MITCVRLVLKDTFYLSSGLANLIYKQKQVALFMEKAWQTYFVKDEFVFVWVDLCGLFEFTPR